MKTAYSLTRRGILKAGLAFAACNALPALAYGAYSSEPEETVRSLHLYNTHTGESLKTVYWEQGVYVTESLKDIGYILRDHRTNDMKDIDVRLLDIIAAVHKKTDSRRPFEVISGYRSPKTNALLYEHTRGVNPNSLHMSGRAIDVRLSGYHLKALRDAAVSLQRGGVGYYPESDFVHIDTGAVQQW